jgi:hypothetical protein
MSHDYWLGVMHHSSEVSLPGHSHPARRHVWTVHPDVVAAQWETFMEPRRLHDAGAIQPRLKNRQNAADVVAQFKEHVLVRLVETKSDIGLRSLEHENAKLRQEIASLSQRLAYLETAVSLASDRGVWSALHPLPREVSRADPAQLAMPDDVPLSHTQWAADEGAAEFVVWNNLDPYVATVDRIATDHFGARYLGLNLVLRGDPDTGVEYVAVEVPIEAGRAEYLAARSSFLARLDEEPDVKTPLARVMVVRGANPDL